MYHLQNIPDFVSLSINRFPTIDKRKYKENIKGNLVRVYCGHEDSTDQVKDIIQALKILK